ncbi:MAG TPA: Npt1/Npt2 family nucleotide transporter [Gammaproteobacteria bacterium]|nr:Npt1/Npt2 family nucleotide transporter [Gammaproteobacteria bacterium]
MSDKQPNFGPIRNLIWPIHRFELKKLVPMFCMFFLITFNYNILRTLKDTLIVTARDSGAEAIPFIKVWVMFPGAIAMTFLFTWLSNRFTREKVFYCILGFFLLYFFLFAFFIYPNHDLLHPHHFADVLQSYLPPGAKGFVAMIRNWTYTQFYVMSELWSNIVLIMLFWGFVNQTTEIHEAKRFYGLFGLSANAAAITSGFVAITITQLPFTSTLHYGENAWDQSIFILITLVVIAGLLCMALFRWYNKEVLTDARLHCQIKESNKGALKGKLSFVDCFTVLFKSKYLICITVIIIAYNLVINLVEILWKDQVKILYPTPTAFNVYMNEVSMLIGMFAAVAAIFIASNSLRKYGWKFTAMITPLILLITSVGFFALLFSSNHIEGMAMSLLGMSPLVLIVTMGTLQNVLSRSAKFTVFDATKEMAFIPLCTETKVKGKAAIDGVFNRLGKSGGSLIHQGLLIMFSTFSAASPYVAVILLLIIAGWIIAVNVLSGEYAKITQTVEPVAEPSTPLIIDQKKPAYSN